MNLKSKRTRQNSNIISQHLQKKRKLNSIKTSTKSVSSLISWPVQSPSPPPPSILLNHQFELHNHSDSDNNLSDISGKYLSPPPSPFIETNINDNQTNINGYNSTNDDNGSISIEIELSPSPPWGRSPEPPPTKFFHKSTKKQSRWDKKDDKLIQNQNNNDKKKAPKSGLTSHNILNNGINIVQSLLVSSVQQQRILQKQKKVEPLKFDAFGNLITNNNNDIDDITCNDDIYYDNDMDLMDMDDDGGNSTDDFGYDDSISHTVRDAARISRNTAFKFIEQGTYTAAAHTIRFKELASLKNKPHRMDILSVAKTFSHSEGLEWLDIVPNVEWWDAPLLSDKNDYNSAYKKEMITSLIQNPIILRPELLRSGHSITTKQKQKQKHNQKQDDNNDNNDNNNNSLISGAALTFLTKKERKKMRRLKKKQIHEEKQNKIRLGLIDPPEPRLKLSNIFRVLGNTAIRDPTAAESIARAQMWKRKIKHELHNETNKLTIQQKRDKKRRKLREDVSKCVFVEIYVIYNLYNKLNKCKICLNADQFNLTGCLIMLNTENKDNPADNKKDDDDKKKILFNDDNDQELSLNMIIIEGGPKGIKKYDNLITRRIKFNVNDTNNCKKIWSGTVAKRSFTSFSQKKMKKEYEIIKYLKMHNVVSYWDMVKNTSSATQTII